MPTFSAKPINDIDRAARAGFRFFCDACAGYPAATKLLGISAKTAERIYKNQRYLPPGLARDAAGLIEAQRGNSTVGESSRLALLAWADFCAAGKEG